MVFRIRVRNYGFRVRVSFFLLFLGYCWCGDGVGVEFVTMV